MFDQSALHFEGANAIASRQDHIVGATHEPEVTVLIDIAAIASQIPVADETCPITLRITAIVLEQSWRGIRFGADRDIAFLLRTERLAALINDRKLETGHRLTHGAEARFHGRMIATHQHGLGLTVAVADHESGGTLPGFDHFWIQRLAGADTVAQMRKLIARQILQHHHAIHRRRATQSGDRVVRQQLQGLLRIEHRRVVHEHRRTHIPRPEITAVGGLGPARVADVPVQVFRPQIEPIAAGDAMRESVAVAVHGHLRIAGSAGGEIAQRVFVKRGVGGDIRGACALHHLVIAQPAVALAINQHTHAQSRALRRHFVELGGIRAIGNESRRLGGVHAVGDVLGRKLRGAGRQDDAHANAGGDNLPPFEIAAQHQDYGVAALDAGRGQRIGELTGARAHLRERAALLMAVVVDPPQRELGRVLRRPLIDHVAREVEARRRRPLEGGAGLLVALRPKRRIAHRCTPEDQNQFSSVARQVSSKRTSNAQRSATLGNS